MNEPVNTKRAGRTARRALSSAIVAVAVAAAFFMRAPWAPAALNPVNSEPDVRIAVSKDAYWYGPEDVAGIRLVLENKRRQAIRGVDVRIRVHVRNESRAELDTCFGGKQARTRFTRVLAGDRNLASGDNDFSLEFDLSDYSFPDGVYPVSLEVVKDGDILASAWSQLVVMDPPDAEDLTPLRLSMVFDTLEPSYKAPDGKFRSDELAGECKKDGRSPGWYANLIWLTEQFPDLKVAFSLSPMLFDQVSDMVDGYLIRNGEKDTVMGPQSNGAQDAAAVIDGFKRITQSGRYDVMRQPYASPDLTAFAALGWTSDARAQYVRGQQVLDEVLQSKISGAASCPPGLLADSRVVKELDREIGEKVMLSSELLQLSSRGRRIARGNTLGQPVEIQGGKGRSKTLALFEDSRIHLLFERLSQSRDPHGVAQCFLSELTNLYLERPGMLRACGALWPGSWHAPREVLNEIARAVSGAPWLKTLGLVETIDAVQPLDADPLEIPDVPTPENDYFARVSEARQRRTGFAQMVAPDNPLLPQLQANLWTSESIAWSLHDRQVDGAAYAAAVTDLVDREVDKVDMPAVGSITMSSADSKIPLSVLNGTAYRITATLRVASNGLEFPRGVNEKVTLEPKENVIEVPVIVNKKGRVRFEARLETKSFILGEVDFTVLTSRFNTFAIAVVGGILALILCVGGVRMITRGKEGRHKRGNVRPPPGEGSQGAGEGA